MDYPLSTESTSGLLVWTAPSICSHTMSRTCTPNYPTQRSGRVSHQFLQWSFQYISGLAKSWLVNLRRRAVFQSHHQYDASRCVLVRRTDLLPAINFELDNTYLTVGGVTLRQTVGASMGGYLSPAMAMMTCMIAERNLHATLGADRRYIAGIRYMDDGTLALCVPHERPHLLNHLRAAALHCYPEGMICKVTGEGTSTRMLEQRIFVNGGKVHACHANKNGHALAGRMKPPFVSFLHSSASKRATSLQRMDQGRLCPHNFKH